MSFVTNLDTPLLRLTPWDNFSLRDACAGVHIFGGIGSGKTSGSGRMLAGAFLRAGFGGCVTAVKPEEVELWRRYAREHGRESSLVLFDENEGFNFLSYELARQGMDGIGTVTECLMRILEAAKRASPTASQKGGEPFWEDATRTVLRYAIPPLYAANGALAVGDIIRFISCAPQSLQDVTDERWQKRSFLFEVMDRAARRPKVPMAKEALQDAIHFWSERYCDIPDKTRGNIAITVTATLDRFKHGRLARAFCQKTSLVQELSLHGAVIVLAMPTLTWNEDGVIAQVLFKYLWQRSMLARNALPEPHRDRPVFLWSDEAQETVSSYDGEFIGMARGSKCCPVGLSQSLPTYFSKIGGDTPRETALGLVGKYMTHIYHANACPETNEYASRTIGKVMMRHGNYNSGTSESFNTGMSEGRSETKGTSHNHGSSDSASSAGGASTYGHNSGSGSSSGSSDNWGVNRGRGTSNNESRSYSESMEYAVEPGAFARILKTGGRENGKLVTGVWFQSGRTFKATGTNTLLGHFQQ